MWHLLPGALALGLTHVVHKYIPSPYRPPLKRSLPWSIASETFPGDRCAASAPPPNASHRNPHTHAGCLEIHWCEQSVGRSSGASYLLQGLWSSQISKHNQGQCQGHRYIRKTRQAADQTYLPTILGLVQDSVDVCGAMPGSKCSERPAFTVNQPYSTRN